MYVITTTRIVTITQLNTKFRHHHMLKGSVYISYVQREYVYFELVSVLSHLTGRARQLTNTQYAICT